MYRRVLRAELARLITDPKILDEQFETPRKTQIFLCNKSDSAEGYIA